MPRESKADTAEGEGGNTAGGLLDACLTRKSFSMRTPS